MEEEPGIPFVVGENAPRTAISDWLDPALGLSGCEPIVDRAAGLVETSSIIDRTIVDEESSQQESGEHRT